MLKHTYILSAWGQLSREGGWYVIYCLPVEQTKYGFATCTFLSTPPATQETKTANSQQD